MVRDDFVCTRIKPCTSLKQCGAPLEPSEAQIMPEIVMVEGTAYYRGVCCAPECDGAPKLVPVVRA